MNSRGVFFVLEGLDGCGKSTQTRLLAEYLERNGHKCKFVHFPILEQGIYGKLIAQFLRGELNTQENVIDCAYNVHPKLVALMYACEREEHAHMIEEWLDDGYTVIADR
jgi:dTMP kinase